MRYWAYIEEMMLGPFSRDELMNLPGFSPATPLCPEDRDGEDPSDWTRASDLEEFSASFALSPASGGTPAGSTGLEGLSRTAEPEVLSPDRLFIEAQRRLEALEDSVNRLEAEKAIKDGIIGSLRVELMRLANEARAAKIDLRISEKSVRYQRDELNRLDDRKERQDKTVRELADDNARKGRQIEALHDDLQRFKEQFRRMREGIWDAPEAGEPLSRRERHVAEEVVDWIVSHWKALGGISDQALRLSSGKAAGPLPPDATIAELERRIERRAKELAKQKVLARRKALAKVKAERRAKERAKAKAEEQAAAKAAAEAAAQAKDLGGVAAPGEEGSLGLSGGLFGSGEGGGLSLSGMGSEEGLSLGLSSSGEEGLSLGGLGGEEEGGLGLGEEAGGEQEGLGLGLGDGGEESGLGLQEGSEEEPAEGEADALSDTEEQRIHEEAIQMAASELNPEGLGVKWLEAVAKAPPEPSQPAAAPLTSPAAPETAPGGPLPPKPADALLPDGLQSAPDEPPPFQEMDQVPAFVPEEPVAAPAPAAAPPAAGRARSRWLEAPLLVSLALLAVSVSLSIWALRAGRRAGGALPPQAGPAQTSRPQPSTRPEPAGPAPRTSGAPCSDATDETERARCQQALAAVQFHSGPGGTTVKRELEAAASAFPEARGARWEVRRTSPGSYRVDFFAGIPDPATDSELEYHFEVSVERGEVKGLNLPARSMLTSQ